MFHNPFLPELEKIYDWRRAAAEPFYMPDTEYYRNYHALRQTYSFGIPTEETIRSLARYCPIVEVGAGLGYWAYLLDQIGCDIVAYDLHPTGGGDFIPKDSHPWFDVQECDESFVPPADRALFICWPPQHSSMASDALSRYRGDTLIYIGEGKGLSCADDAFFNALDTWECIEEIDIPQLNGMHDRLWVFKREDADDGSVQPDYDNERQAN